MEPSDRPQGGAHQSVAQYLYSGMADSQIKSNQIKSNQIKSNQIKSNQIIFYRDCLRHPSFGVKFQVLPYFLFISVSSKIKDRGEGCNS